jgi:hypothetical protein
VEEVGIDTLTEWGGRADEALGDGTTSFSKSGDGCRMEEAVDGVGFCPVEDVWIFVALTG